MPEINLPELLVCQYSCRDESQRFIVENPATGVPLTTVQGGNTATVFAAVEASQTAFEKSWRPLSNKQRCAYLLQCADALESHIDEVAQLLCLENGKPFKDAKAFDCTLMVSSFRFFAGIVDKLPQEFYDRDETYSTIFREPHGVCCGILPFNWPPIHAAAKTAPALAAGNTIILKPAEQAPLTVLKIVSILESVLPAGVVQAVPGLGIEVPQALVVHPSVKMISFTGSTAGGAAIASAAGKHIKPVKLELGGKNAFVIFDDADLNNAVRDAIEGIFFNKGEACTATARLLVQRSVHDEVVQKLGAAVRCLKVGDGQDHQTHVGPQVSKTQQKRVLDFVALGVAEGATIIAQASLPKDPKLANGFFCPPTLFANVTRDMRLFNEEIFGPVATITVFDTYDEAIDLVNCSEYGLTTCIHTRDIAQANRAARAIEVGAVYINNYRRNALGVPHGGVKKSGYGREHWIGTLTEWSTVKAVHTLSSKTSVGRWRAIEDVFDN